MIRTARLDLDDNRSMWAATAPTADPLAPLSGDVTADVVIIGAGFTGISTAYHLARRYPDRRVVVLEARRIGNGASGRSGGMALNWINGVELRHREVAVRNYEVTKAGIDWIAEVIAEHGLNVRFRRTGCLESTTNARRAEIAHEKAERLASWGIPVRYLSGSELASTNDAVGVVGAILDPTAGCLHGLDLLLGLRRVILGLGVQVHEGSPVVRIEEGRTHVVTTPGGTVRAPWMVLATNAYTPRLGYFGGQVLPLHSHVLATDPLSPRQLADLGWGETTGFTDDKDRIAYASLSADGRLVFGGGGNRAYTYLFGSRTAMPREPESAFRFIRGFFERYFPGMRDLPVVHRWSGTLGVTLSRVCSMGVTGAHANVLYALGYSGHGVVLANLAGKVLCDLYSDHHEPWRDLPFYQRNLHWVPGEPFRWLGYHAHTAFTGRSPRRWEPA